MDITAVYSSPGQADVTIRLSTLSSGHTCIYIIYSYIFTVHSNFLFDSKYYCWTCC